MTLQKKQYILLSAITAAVLIIDQVIKICVKCNMMLGDDIPLIGSWCRLHFVENEGAAFGMKFGGDTGKYILSIFRILAASGILWYILYSIKKGTRTFMVVTLSLIFVGALGNIVDSCLYGLIFTDSSYQLAQIFPAGGGYGKFLLGRVVDMFYFPIIDTVLPTWVPFWGGKPFLFFSAIFNFADSAITIGAILLIVDQLFFNKRHSKSAE